MKNVWSAQLDPPPGFLGPRVEMFEKLKKEYDEWMAGLLNPLSFTLPPYSLLLLSAAQESQPIKVTLPDGKTVGGASWKTTPYDVACQISKGLADNTVIAKVYTYIHT